MESVIDPILRHILSYFTFYEVTPLSRVNKQFQRVRKQLILVKPPDGRFVSTLVKLNNNYSHEAKFNDTIACKGRFTCSGCEILQIRKIQQEHSSATGAQQGSDVDDEDEDDPELQVCLVLLAEKGVNEGVGDDDGEEVTLLVRGFFDFDPDGQYDKMRKVLRKIYPGLEALFCSLIFIGRVLDKIIDQIISLVIEKSQGDEEVMVTLDKIRETISIVFPFDLSTDVLMKANTNITQTNRLIFNVDAVRSQILSKYPEIQFEIDSIIVLVTALECTCEELLELSGNAARRIEMDIVLVDHLITVIKADSELRKLIKLEELDPSWLRNDSRQERVLKARIMSESSTSTIVETEPFPIRLRKVMNAQVLEISDIYQNKKDFIEGVLFVDNFIRRELHESLRDNINKFAAGQIIPESGDMVVREIVDPELYWHVEGVSQFVPSDDLPSKPPRHNNRTLDLWGRGYDSSPFQSLPTYIDSQDDGLWRFRNEINNLPKEENEALYQNLEEIFSLCVPYLEQVIGYAMALGGKDQTAKELRLYSLNPSLRRGITGKTHIKPYKLNGKSLQVICKIVEIEIQPGEIYEGVWHLEGLPQENIIASVDYNAEQDSSIVGADLGFMRAFLSGEVSILHRTEEDITSILNHMSDNDTCPLGSVETKEGRLIVFPNSHVHKYFYGKNIGRSVAKRKNVVFHVVNPEVRIISTQEVTPSSQIQEASPSEILWLLNSHKEALQYRLELAEVQNYDEQEYI